MLSKSDPFLIYLQIRFPLKIWEFGRFSYHIVFSYFTESFSSVKIHKLRCLFI